MLNKSNSNIPINLKPADKNIDKITTKQVMAFQCINCHFINLTLTNCPKCNSYVLTMIIILKPDGFSQVKQINSAFN